MAIQRQNLPITFAMGLDLKSDPKQIDFGKFLELENSVFVTGKLLQKRNGFPMLPPLPDASYRYLNTFNTNLVAIGENVTAFSDASDEWHVKGSITPIDLEVLPLIRSSNNEAFVDAAIAPNGLICTAYYTDSFNAFYYAIVDSVTGQNIVAPTIINAADENPRVFTLGNYFIILRSSGTNLIYNAIPVNNPTSPGGNTTLVTNYAIGGDQLAFDGIVSNNNLYVSYNATDGGGAIRATFLNSFLVRQTAATGVVLAAALEAEFLSMCADETQNNPTIWTAFYESGGPLGSAIATDSQLNIVLAADTFTTDADVCNIALTAQNAVATIFYEIDEDYSYGTPLPTHFINSVTLTEGGTLGTPAVMVRSVGIASKAFLMEGVSYMLSAYDSDYQPSYFLINDSGEVVSKLAYSNGGGYVLTGLPSASVVDNVVKIPYLIAEEIIAANKSQGASNTGKPVYVQAGINLASFEFTLDETNTTEIGGNLNISGGILWTYDGYQVVEQGFNVYPDNIVVTTATGSGNITAQIYYYVGVYEWTDAQGNIHRSAPSLPVTITTSTASSTNTINFPTLRLTYKTSVKLMLYRWSTAQQTYYQVTSILSPTLNNPAVDSIAITDTQVDSAIIGNSILYTTGGVIENISAPPTAAMTLFRSRLFLVDAENRNLLWYSKQVIQNTPVEMSDLFTLYVAPTTSAHGNTGPMSALGAMDDKMIIFKDNAIYYLVGNGPDNTGAGNDFSEPIFITSTIGCSNQNSVVFIPNGLMFESDKGIWLLGRDLSTTYIGASVESATDVATVLSAITVPGTNEVRFTMSDGTTLMYDYFYGQWGTFTGIPGISSTLYQDKHTFINSYGEVYQELENYYLDGSRPVQMRFKTGWLNLAGLQGYQRAYFFDLLGTYLSPHKLSVDVAYDYQPPSQSMVINPINYSPAYGGDPLFGSASVMGGPSNVEQWQCYFENQKCEAFQITLQEIYDPSFGVAAGAGLNLSGINLVVGLKKAYPALRSGSAVSIG
jgi:hypothetical protein